MGLGNFLTGDFFKDVLRGAGFQNPDATSDWLNRFNNAGQDATNPAAAAGQSGAFFAKEAYEGLTSLPLVGGAIQGAIELPNRGWDTIWMTAAHARAVGYKATGEKGSWEEWEAFFDKQSWSKAWNSWGQDDHVTAGALTVPQIFGGDDHLVIQDPFTPEGRRGIQAYVEGQPGGEFAAGASDLAYSFLIPGLGTASKIRTAATGAKEVRTAADAERIAAHVATEGFGDVKRYGDLARGLVDRSLDPSSMSGRLAAGVQKSDGIHDENAMMDLLGPMMENSPDHVKALYANTFTLANRITDADLRTKVKVNALLAGYGSETARASLAADAPLLYRNMENLATKPKGFAVAEDIFTARLHDPDNPVTVSEILERNFNTAGDKFELDALRDFVRTTEVDAKAARDFRAQVRAAKPSLKGFDADRLKELRIASKVNAQQAKAAVESARRELDNAKRWATAAYKQASSKAGMENVGELSKTRGRRDAAAAFDGPVENVRDFSHTLGEARAKLAAAEERYAALKSDRELFESTPLPGWEELADWKVEMADARRAVKEADVNAAWATALKRQQVHQLAAKRAEMAELYPGANQVNDLVNDIFSLGEDGGSVLVGRFEQTNLDKLKTYLRSRGSEVVLRPGDGLPPVVLRGLPTRAARFAMAPRARGAINLSEVDLGRRQLEDALHRSKVFAPEEIATATRDLIRGRQANRQDVVARYQEQMLERIAMKHFGDKFETPEEALKYAKQLTEYTTRHWGSGNDWIAKAVKEQEGTGRIVVRADDEVHVFDEATVKSHLADNAPMIDPEDFEQLIQRELDTFVSNARHLGNVAVNLNDVAMKYWKMAALLRPGLAVRAALDTNFRALALMGSAETFMTTMNATANFLANTQMRGMAKLRLRDLNLPEQAAEMRRIGMKGAWGFDRRNRRTIGKSGQKRAFYLHDDLADRARNQEAMSKGNSVHDALYSDYRRELDRFHMDRSQWRDVAPEHPKWDVAYQQWVQQLYASPSVRWFAERMHGVKNGVGAEDLLEEWIRTPDFIQEYTKIAQPRGRSVEDYATWVIDQVEKAFPNPGTVIMAKTNAFSRKAIERAFPPGTRPVVPAPVMRKMDGIGVQEKIDSFANKAFGLLLDKPDMWLARNPTAAALYRGQLKDELRAAVRSLPEGVDEVSPQMLAKIDARAKQKAIQQVRRTFFDTTRHTSAHHYLTRVSPFFAAWEDAMISWGRLIHDDPRRLVALVGAFNAPATLNPWMPKPILIDRDGNPIRRGQDHEGAFIPIPVKINGSREMRVRLGALNSIAQGEVWWLPGFGPQAVLPTTALLGKALPNDVALDILSADNPLLNSMFLDGELPRADVGEMARSVLPGWVRQIANDSLGTGLASNYQTNFNYRIAEALARGEVLNDARLTQLHEQARKAAVTASIVRLVSGAGFGMTGTATVDGQFYVEQMHLIQAQPRDQLLKEGFDSPEAKFSHLFPEAADLDWTLSKNETGIVASVQAQKSATRLAGILNEKDAALGWMILGADNVVSPEFSRTAYNMQLDAGGRRRLNEKELRGEVQAAVGWREWQNFQQVVRDTALQMGMSEDDPRLVAARRAYATDLMQRNTEWARDYNTREEKFPTLFAGAMTLSSDRRLKDRSDMVAFRDYADARQELLDTFGLKSFEGVSPAKMQARAILRQEGQRLADRDLGFQQMWQRFLSGEVEE